MKEEFKQLMDKIAENDKGFVMIIGGNPDERYSALHGNAGMISDSIANAMVADIQLARLIRQAVLKFTLGQPKPE